MTSKKVVRRLMLAMCCAVAVVVAGCGGSESTSDSSTQAAADSAEPAKGTGTLTLAGFGGTTQKALDKIFLQPFAEEKGLRPLDDAVDYGKLYSMVDAGKVTWDVAIADGWFARQACDEGKAEKLTDVVKQAIERAGLPEGSYNDCYIQPWSYSWVLAYSTDLAKKPTSWAAFTDTANYPGERTAWSFDQVGLYEAATLAAGKSVDEVYPLDFKTVFANLDKIKGKIAFSESLQQQITDLVTGRAKIGLVTANRAYDAKAAGEKVDFMWDQQILTGEPYFVPKGSPNKDAAMEFLASLLETDKLLAFAKANKYGPNGSVAQEELAKQSWCEQVTTCPSHLPTALKFSDDWWADNRKEAERQWKSWLGA
jgi:putative spermidine/putrescine transport system substrate-binding protein